MTDKEKILTTKEQVLVDLIDGKKPRNRKERILDKAIKDIKRRGRIIDIPSNGTY